MIGLVIHDMQKHISACHCACPSVNERKLHDLVVRTFREIISIGDVPIVDPGLGGLQLAKGWQSICVPRGESMGLAPEDGLARLGDYVGMVQCLDHAAGAVTSLGCNFAIG